jgi:MFS transporter, DHA2 family, multidrug resistance protein
MRAFLSALAFCFSATALSFAHLDTDLAGPQIFMPLVIRAIGQPLIIVPLSVITTAGMAKGSESAAKARNQQSPT